MKRNFVNSIANMDCSREKQGKMGNEGSKKKRAGGVHFGETSQQSSITKTTTVNNSKYVMILHCSHTQSEVSTVENFRDALESEADGMVDVSETVNLTECAVENAVPDSWLKISNNVVLICLPSDLKAVESIAKVVRDKHFADKENRLLSEVVAVSFGTSLPTGWPPCGVTRPAGGKKDFCFGKETGKALTANDFEGQALKSLIQTIVGMK